MAKMESPTAFKTYKPRADTPMDKITRAAMKIVNGETELREVKTARLRKARLKREASMLAK